MRFDIITLFPSTIIPFFQEGIIARAQKEKLIEIEIHDLRKWTTDKHHVVDDKPYGGGRGMILKIGPIFRAVESLKQKKKRTRVILFSPRGKIFDQSFANNYTKFDQLILISGRYEGVDERVFQYIADDILSIGNYTLMSGDLPAIIVVESVGRLTKGVIGSEEEIEERVSSKGGFKEYPQYTRPEVFTSVKGTEWKVPPELLSGDHRKIKQWRENRTQIIES
jgi:tRNA (guanine37-N1)-methyltransferase